MDLGATLPISLTASTAATSNANAAVSCGGGAANDAWFVWTAPRAGPLRHLDGGDGLRQRPRPLRRRDL
ncbi:MAG: hypothetical protein M5U28_17835 [Sandaracinaceae bacterium]|nr:hypothetical protein [Sandaracinaceae bacterium]